MIYTVTCNPAVDHTVWIDHFRTDSVNRIVRSRRDPGGKGINVSKVIHALGGQSIACGILGGQSGAYIADTLTQAGIAHRFVPTDAETRTNLKIIDSVAHTTTDLNEPGAPVDQNALDSLRDFLCRCATKEDIFILSGSLPTSASPDLYADWTRALKARGAQVFLDTSGEALSLASAQAPDLVKPNANELCHLVGRALTDENDYLQAGRELIRKGIGCVVISLGEAGALFLDETGAWRADGLTVPVESTVGAGDAMVAALAMCREAGLSLEQSIPHALTVSAAAVMTQGTQPPRPEDVSRLLGGVSYRKIAT